MIRYTTPYWIVCVLFLTIHSEAQKTWSLVISSNVELRTLKLTNKAEQNTRPLKGATITLYQGNTLIKQSHSSGSGDFSVLVPPDGEYMIVVSYPGCNAKKFQISTLGVPDNFDQDGWEPGFPIGGVIMAKPLYSIDYSALQQPVVKVIFKQKGKVFDDDGAYTEEALARLRKIKSDEDDLIARFLEAVNAGDAALKKPDCPLAKAMYEKALSLIPNEEYPIAQLAKVGDCLVEKERTDKIAAAEAEKKHEEEAARQKVKDERKAKEVAQARQFAKDKEEQKAKQKDEDEKLAKEKEIAAKKAAENEDGEKAAKTEVVREAEKETKKESKKADEQKVVSAPSKKENPEKPKKHKEAAPAIKKSEITAADVVAGSQSSGQGNVKSRKTRYSTPQVIGTTQYQKLISEADGKFREKDYVRAKVLYTKALDLKPADAYATEKLKEIKTIEKQGN